MKRIVIITLASLSIALFGCGTEAGTGGGQIVEDGAGGADAGGQLDGSAVADAAADAGATDAGTVCTPGEAKCGTGAAVTRLVCKADGSGWDETICDGLNAGCEAGTCITADGGAQLDAAGGGDDAGSTTQDTGSDPCGGLCTASQTCVDGICVDGAPCGGKCPSGTECKNDACMPIPCGGPCPKGQFCDKEADAGNGKCIDPTCKLPTTWGPGLQKISKFTLKPAGQGCDLNGDGKEDNAIGLQLILDGVNNWLKDEMDSGDRVTFLLPSAWKTDATPFDIILLTGIIDPSNKTCDKSAATCKYQVHPWNYDIFFNGTAACPPKAWWSNVTNTKGALKGGSDKQQLAVGYTFDGEFFPATIHRAYISGTVTDDTAWKSTKAGLLCGVMTEKELFKLIDAVPESQMPAGVTKEQIKSLLPSFITTDIDTDGDGKNDAYSAAFDFESIPAEITGYTP